MSHDIAWVAKKLGTIYAQKPAPRVRRAVWPKGVWMRVWCPYVDLEFQTREVGNAAGTLMTDLMILTPENKLVHVYLDYEDLIAKDWDFDPSYTSHLEEQTELELDARNITTIPPTATYVGSDEGGCKMYDVEAETPNKYISETITVVYTSDGMGLYGADRHLYVLADEEYIPIITAIRNCIIERNKNDRGEPKKG